MKRLVMLVTILVLIAPACGGGDSSDSDPDAAAQEPSAAPSTEAPFANDDESEAEGPDMTACQKGGKSKTEVALTQVDFMFKPMKIKAPAGEMVSVVVKNEGTVDHTFTSDEVGCDSGLISPGAKTTVTFEMPDKPTIFFCIPHEQAMKGELLPA